MNLKETIKKAFVIIVSLVGSICLINASNVTKSDNNVSPCNINYKKSINGNLLIPNNSIEINNMGAGPFIRLKNNDIFKITEGINASISKDNGKTWTSYPVVDKEKHSMASAVSIESSDGVLVVAFSDYKEKFWDWDKNIYDAPNAVLPTYTVRSLDGGRTWQNLQKLHDDWTGAIRSIIETKDGDLIFTTMMLKHNPGRHTVLTYTSKDNGANWHRSNILDMGGRGDHSGLMESTIVQLNDGRIWQLIRTNWGYFFESFSNDNGKTWSNPQKTTIDASSAPAALTRLKSGKLILVWNRMYPEGTTYTPLLGGKQNPNLSDVESSWQREELSMAFSDNDGKNWSSPVVVAKVYKDSLFKHNSWDSKRWLAYPQIFEVNPGKIWITTDFGGVRIEINERDYAMSYIEDNYKPTNDGRVLIKDGVKQLNELKGAGPYIRLANDDIFTMRGNNAAISKDDGTTWEYYLVLETEKYGIASPVFIETGKGTIVMAFMNLKEKNWNWDKNKHDSPDAKLPTCVIRSVDGGKTWSNFQKLHDDWTGAIRAIIETKKGNIVFSTMMLKHNPGHHTVLTYTSKNDGIKWKRSNILDLGGSGDHSGLMESTIIHLNDGRIWQLIRTNWGFFYESFSKNEGKSWSKPEKTKIDASSSPAALTRLKSGRLILVWNRMYPKDQSAENYKLNEINLDVSEVPTSWQRDELAVMTSDDDGKTWTAPVIIAKMNKNSKYVHTTWTSKQLSYPHIFEPFPGEIWITTEAGSLRTMIKEDFLFNVN